MGFGFEIIFVIMMLFGTGPRAGGDALDFLPTDAYWQSKHITVELAQLEADAGPSAAPEHLEALAKDLESDEFKTRNIAKKKSLEIGPAALPLLRSETNSKDPEVKTAAAALVQQLQTHARERDIRRLMAIRTLGEHKEHAALPLLKDLTASKQLFVAEYAARAIAQIEGKTLKRPDPREAVLADLKLLPTDSCVVGQTVGLAQEPLTMDAIVDMAIAQAGQMPAGMPQRKMPAKPVIIQRAVQEILKGLERIGNVRLDGLTFQVSSDAGPNGGSAVVILRGEYDRTAVIETLHALHTAQATDAYDRWNYRREGDVEVIDAMGETLLLCSNEQIIFILGEKPSLGVALTKILAAVKTGAGTFSQNKEMAALLKTIDTRSPLWVAARLNAAMRMDVFSPFDSVTLATQTEKDGTSFQFSAHGTDADKVKSSIDTLNGEIATALTAAKMEAVQMRALQPAVDLLQSLKLEQNAADASMKGELKSTILSAIAGQIGPMIPLMGIDDGSDEAGINSGAPATQP